MENKNKNIDDILSEYASATGKSSNKSLDLGKLYKKENESRRALRPHTRRLAQVCVAAVLLCAVLVSASVYGGNPLHEYTDGSVVDGMISSSSSSNKGGFYDSLSEWLESLKGDKQPSNDGGGSAGDKGDNGAMGDRGEGSVNISYTISEEKRNEMIDAYYDNVKAENQNVKREDIVLDFFVAVNEAYAIRINAGWLYECKPSSETVGGVEFHYSYGPAESYGIKIYYDGKFYRLAEAFDAGIINTDALYVIRDAYKNR